MNARVGGATLAGSHDLDGRGWVRREALLRTLESVTGDVRLISLVAPAGYGKTTVLRQWADQDGRRFGWIRLGEPDNDPAVLRRRITEVLPPASDPRWVLILDDAHLLHHDRCLDVLAALAGEMPVGCQVVIAGRSHPGPAHSPVLGAGSVVLGPAELSLSADETATLIGSVGLDLSREAVDALHARTEGWPAVTYLATLSIAEAPDAAAAASMVGGGDAFISDYFRDEVLANEPADLIRFLLHTAPLEQMTPALCDFVTGQSGSAVWLTGLERRNLVSVADVAGEGPARRWYRYHGLLAEMLRSELRRREPGEEQRGHRRAAIWYDVHSRPEAAMRHAFAARDSSLLFGLISRHAYRLVNEGRQEVPQRWLAELDTATLEAHPPLAVQSGWIWAIGGNAARALRCLLIAEAGLRAARAPAARVIAATATLRAALAPEGLNEMVRDARAAVAAHPSPGPAQACPAALLGVALLLTGDVEAGAAQLKTAVALGDHREAQFARAQLSLLAAHGGDWAVAAGYAREARAYAERGGAGQYATCVPAYAAHAAVALQDGDLAAAQHDLDQALHVHVGSSPTAFPWLGAQMAIELGRIQLILDDHAGAEVRAAEARRYLARLTTEGMLRQWYGDLAAALGSHDEEGAGVLTRAEIRILSMLPSYLTLGQIADKLYISRNTAKSHVAAVYRKLNASSRAQAVQQGRTLGLIAS